MPSLDRGAALAFLGGPERRSRRPAAGTEATRGRFGTVLRDIYTPVEKTLIDAGRFAAVKETRTAFRTRCEKSSDAVEDVVGRRVIGFLSQVQVDPDLAVETFILQRDDGPLPAVAEE